MGMSNWINNGKGGKMPPFTGYAPYLPGSLGQAFRAVRNELRKRFGAIADVEFVMFEPDKPDHKKGQVAIVLPDNRGVIKVEIAWMSEKDFEAIRTEWKLWSKHG